MSDIERTLLAIIKFKDTEDDYSDRQDYLAAILRSADKWFTKHDPEGDVFDNLDDPVATWFDQATDQMNKKREIPDFPDLEESEEYDNNDVGEEEPDEEADQDEEAQDEADEQAPDPDPAGEPEGAETDPAPAPDPGSDTGADPDPRSPAAPEGGPPEPHQAKPKKVKKPKREPTGYENITGEKDRFGVVLGTKTAKAVAMYEKAASVRNVTDALGGRHYNILVKLAKDGHLVEKLPDKVFRLTHKNDVAKRKKA